MRKKITKIGMTILIIFMLIFGAIIYLYLYDISGWIDPNTDTDNDGIIDIIDDDDDDDDGVPDNQDPDTFPLDLTIGIRIKSSGYLDPTFGYKPASGMIYDVFYSWDIPSLGIWIDGKLSNPLPTYIPPEDGSYRNYALFKAEVFDIDNQIALGIIVEKYFFESDGWAWNIDSGLKEYTSDSLHYQVVASIKWISENTAKTITVWTEKTDIIFSTE